MRREGALQDYVAQEKYLKLCTDITLKVQKKCLATEPIDLRGAGHDLNVHDQRPRLEPMGHLRVLHVNVHGLNYANNNMDATTSSNKWLNTRLIYQWLWKLINH